jgi:hypothetical protein
LHLAEKRLQASLLKMFSPHSSEVWIFSRCTLLQFLVLWICLLWCLAYVLFRWFEAWKTS